MLLVLSGGSSTEQVLALGTFLMLGVTDEVPF